MRSDRPRQPDDGRTGSLYCTGCGGSLERATNYCPNCGTATGRSKARSNRVSAPDSASRPRPRADRSADGTHPTDRERLERRIAAASRNGWRLERDVGDHAVVVRRTVGSVTDHLLVALVTVWWTMGIGNVLYGAYRYVDGAERMVLRGDRIGGDAADGRDDTTGESTLFRRVIATLGWLLATITAWLGVQFGAIGASTASHVLFASALLFVVAGTSVLPSVSRRLEARHSVLTNGRTRSVDERTVAATANPCAVCAGPVDRGLERTYRSEFCVLGVPVTATEGRNYYCRTCANAESAAIGASDSAAVTDPTAGGPLPRPNSDPDSDGESESDPDRA